MSINVCVRVLTGLSTDTMYIRIFNRVSRSQTSCTVGGNLGPSSGTCGELVPTALGSHVSVEVINSRLIQILLFIYCSYLNSVCLWYCISVGRTNGTTQTNIFRLDTV